MINESMKDLYIHRSDQVDNEELDKLIACFHEGDLNQVYAYNRFPQVDIQFREYRFVTRTTLDKVEKETAFRLCLITTVLGKMNFFFYLRS